MVQTAEYCGVSAVAVHQGCRLFLCGAQADSHGTCDHGDSPVARRYGGRFTLLQVAQFSVVTQRLVPWSRRFVRPSGFPSCFTLCSMSLFAGRADFPCRVAEADSHGLGFHQTIEIPQLRVGKVVDAHICRSCSASWPVWTRRTATL